MNSKPINDQNAVPPPVSPPEQEKKEEPLSSSIREIAKEQIEKPPSPNAPPRKIKAAELKTEIETRKLKKVASAATFATTTPKPPARSPSFSVNLEPYKLGFSSNPVALLKGESYVPIGLLEAEIQKFSNNQSILTELGSFSRHFVKAGVLNNLYILLSKSTDSETSDKIIALIKELNSRSEEYLTDADLHKMGVDFKGLTLNLEPLIKASSLVAKGGVLPVLAQRVIQNDKATPINQRKISHAESIVYKGGNENMREILASKKAEIEGYDDVLHLKEPVLLLEDVALTWGEKGALMHPIKSDFLEGYRHYENKHWTNWGEARKKYDLELFQKGTVSEETLKELQAAEQEIQNYQVDPTSVCKLAFYELKINSNDFHQEQFMIGPDPKHAGRTRMVSIDEGRWGPPTIAYEFITSPAPSLKNSLITHPDCLKPVTEEFKAFLKHRLNEIDHTAQKMAESGLICSKEDFEAMTVAYKEASETLSKLARSRIKATELPALANKYQIPFDSNTSMKELSNAIENHLRAKKIELKEKSFARQSEQSLVKEMEREKRMAEYLLNTPNATLYGAFEVGYSEFATFMKVLRRIEVDPGKSLAYVSSGGILVPRELKTFIQKAEKEGLASQEEIEQMKKDLEKIKSEQSTTTIAMALTHNAY